MIEPSELKLIYEHSYIPEHLPWYVCSISETEPFFENGYVYYVRDRHLIFIGYPLQKGFDRKEANELLRELISRHKVKTLAAIGEVRFNLKGRKISDSSDLYYRIELSRLKFSRKIINSMRRAEREISVETTREFTEKHQQLIEQYLLSEKFDPLTKFIFRRVKDYVEKSDTALIITAKRRDGAVSGFNVFELGSMFYGFYMFNFISRQNYVPGVSDLLMNEMIEVARKEKKEFINLGLGINRGVSFFKRKWGAQPFLNYQFEYLKLSWIEIPPLRKILDFMGRKL